MSDGFRLPGREGEPVPAAVLVPLVNRPQGLQVLLTQRSADLPDHPGQISFPGGRVDPGDTGFAATALRETAEEIGLPPSKVDILGELSTYVTVSGYSVRPVVGWVEPPFDLAPDPVEVADAFEVPLEFLLDRAHHQRHHRTIGEIRRDYWAIPWLQRYIWGATRLDAADPRADADRRRLRRIRHAHPDHPPGHAALPRSFRARLPPHRL